MLFQGVVLDYFGRTYDQKSIYLIQPGAGTW